MMKGLAPAPPPESAEMVQDGRINYTEFVAMMRKGAPEAANPKKRRDVML